MLESYFLGMSRAFISELAIFLELGKRRFDIVWYHALSIRGDTCWHTKEIMHGNVCTKAHNVEPAPKFLNHLLSALLL